MSLRRLFLLLFVFVTFNNLMFANVGKDTIILQLKWKHQFQFAGFYAAIEKGFYEAEGLNVILNTGDSGINIIKEVMTGNAHFGIESSSLIIARNNNIPVVALAAIFQHSPEVLIARKDSDIKLIKDIKNKHISLGSNGLASTKALLLKFNIPQDNLQYGNSTSLTKDLINKETDIIESYITDAPYILDKAGIDQIHFKPRSYGIDFYGDILFTSQNQVENNKRRVEKFTRASLKGWKYAMDNKPELIKIIRDKYNSSLSEEQLLYEATAMEDLIMPKLIEVGHMNPERWKYIGDMFVQIGKLQPLFSIEGFLFEDYQRFNDKKIKRILFILIAILGISLISLIVFFLFNRRLKKAVLDRTNQLSTANQKLTQEINNRKLAHTKLTLSEERFKRLFEDSPISLWEEDFSTTKRMLDQLAEKGETDIENYLLTHPEFVAECAQQVKILDVNKATLLYMEVDNKEAIINNVKEVFSASALNDFAKELITFYQGKLRYETESEHITFKGNKINVSITVKILNGYEKTWSKVIVSLINISDLRKTTQQLKHQEIQLIQQNEVLKGINLELKKAKTKAEESDKLKTAFLSNMSHEIRTPMNGIVGFTDLLKDRTLTDEENKRYLSIIEENSQQLLRIISDIIDISKIEASQLNITQDNIDIKHLFIQLHEIFTLRIKRFSKLKLEIHYSIHPDLPTDLCISSDITRLRQVLTNLLENAVKFTEEGSIEFGVCPVKEKGHLLFYVKDSGVGIKQERVAQIFERFFREEERFGANLGGTGLGLSIAKNLVELLGGKISVESKPDVGSTFFFTHPYNL